MNRSSTPRYCRCGTRLGQDHSGGRCSPCEKQLAALRAQAPDVSADFWETEQLSDAFVAQHIGQVSRAYRKHPHHVAAYGKDGIPQAVVGDWLGLTQAQISRIKTVHQFVTSTIWRIGRGACAFLITCCGSSFPTGRSTNRLQAAFSSSSQTGFLPTLQYSPEW